MDYVNYILIFGAGLIASFINAMAGGGSLLTIGAMILLGIPPSVANGTNRVGVLVGTVSTTGTFASNGVSDIKETLKYGLITIPGAIIGSYYSISISGALFQRILSVVMIVVLITLFLPKSIKESSGEKRGVAKLLVYPIMFGVGFYGGFIQAGVGFFMMAAFRHLLNMDLVKINMHKSAIVLIYTVPLILVFGFTSNINWLYAIVLSIGNAIGAWASVKLSLKKGEKLVKMVLAVAVVMMAAKFMMV